MPAWRSVWRSRASLSIGSRGGPRPRPQPRQAAIVVVARAAERHAQSGGDVAQAQILEARELDGPPLGLRQLRERTPQHPAAFLTRQLAAVRDRRRPHVLE